MIKFNSFNENLLDNNTYIIGYPSGEIIDIKEKDLSELIDSGVVYYERKFEKYFFIDSYRNHVIDKITNIIYKRVKDTNKIELGDNKYSVEQNVNYFLTNFCKLKENAFKIVNNTIDVFGDVKMDNLELSRIPYRFGDIYGDFDCSDNKLKNLINSPKLVDGDFICSRNNLYSLTSGPYVTRGYFCRNNFIDNLNGLSLSKSAVEFNASNNLITKINYNLLENIKILNIDNNRLTELNIIWSAKNLQILHCERNLIVKARVSGLSELKEFYCYDNKIEKLEGIEGMKELQVLSCRNNKLRNLYGIEELNNLKFLYCDSNNFSDSNRNWLINFCKEKNIRYTI